MNQYFIPITVGACGIVLFLIVSFYGFISFHRGSGRSIATTDTDGKVMPGDGRRLYNPNQQEQI